MKLTSTTQRQMIQRFFAGAILFATTVLAQAAAPVVISDAPMKLITATTPAVFPVVELERFTAVNDQEIVTVIWASASEYNCASFTIERSKFGEEWEEVATVNALGNGSTGKQYFYTDREPFAGRSSYRLRVNSNSGTVSHTAAVEVVSMRSLEAFSLYPNPNNGNLFFVKLDSDFRPSASSQVVVYDMMGREVLRESSVRFDGNGKVVVMPSRKLGNGLYQVILHNGNTEYSSKLIVR